MNADFLQTIAADCKQPDGGVRYTRLASVANRKQVAFEVIASSDIHVLLTTAHTKQHIEVVFGAWIPETHAHAHR